MKTQEKLDLYKVHKADYAAIRKPGLVKVNPAHYLAIDGQGAPGGDVFVAAIGALYAMAFTIKMTRKFGGLQDYVVCKLECQWDDLGTDFTSVAPEHWRWKMLIRTPDCVTRKELGAALAVLLKRGKEPAVKQVRLESLDEGKCVQMLHVGPYDQVCNTIALMREWAGKKGLHFAGRHHEIYLSDPRRVPPERLKTIVRHPVKPALNGRAPPRRQSNR